MPQALALVALLAVTTAIGAVWRTRQGRVRVTAPAEATTGPATADRWAALGVALGARVTFVQLSAEVCAPCRATARVLRALAAAEDGVTHHELDVDAHLDLVTRLRVLTTPTVLVLDPDGVEIARASGAMTPAQARAALALCP
ncbi:thioredoxin family protein [Xylanimonas ulmi]|uniref:Thiol-disulfide isomerase/thioredoxin n=1 Tax=Xylanimonas ulmi TaxID=228973 RepID=A0A4Q7M575_9MICO|nr:thioredoxin family protein [Xylanibacterium ulmi]RZS62183.1 thiol-disulfide isomerase/thioredoxin [Xylanibacterium ulmi]